MDWRTLRANETDHELVWLAVSTATAGLGALWLRFDLPAPPCFFHSVTGCPCPTCGVTRAMRHLVHGDLAGAIHFNPLAVVGIGLMLLFDLYAAVVLAFRLPRFRFEDFSPPAARRIRIAVCSSVLLNWAWLICARV